MTQECWEQYWIIQHPTKHHLYGHLPPVTKTIQVRRTRLTGHCWRSRDELIRAVLLLTPTYGRAKAGRPAGTYSSYLRIRDVALKTCLRRWTIGKSGERGSGISVLAARHDDDDIYIYIYIYIYIKKLLLDNLQGLICHEINYLINIKLNY